MACLNALVYRVSLVQSSNLLFIVSVVWRSCLHGAWFKYFRWREYVRWGCLQAFERSSINAIDLDSKCYDLALMVVLPKWCCCMHAYGLRDLQSLYSITAEECCCFSEHGGRCSTVLSDTAGYGSDIYIRFDPNKLVRAFAQSICLCLIFLMCWWSILE